MKNFIPAIIALLFLAACQTSQPKEEETPEEAPESNVTYYGDSISEEGAIDAKTFMAQMEGKDSLDVKLIATINETCQMKGCWMKMDMGNEKDIRVTFKDYAFFVPKEGVDGKTAVIQGRAFIDTLSVDMLRHYAEDGGETAEQIAAITEPEVTLSFEADGVIIKD